MNFKLLKTDKDSRARAGVIKTDHGEIETPIFMPVGTAGTVKGVHQRELDEDIQAQIILGNTYHLYLRPGLDTLEQAEACINLMVGTNQSLPIRVDIKFIHCRAEERLSKKGWSSSHILTDLNTFLLRNTRWTSSEQLELI